MPAVSAQAFDASVRHAVLLERLKAGQTRTVLGFLREMDKDVRLRLSGAALTGVQRARLEVLLADIGQGMEAILQRATGALRASLGGIATAEAAFQSRALTEAVQNAQWEAVLPAPEQIRAAVFSAPLAVRGAGGGKLLDTFLQGFTAAQVAAVTGVIRRGVFEGQTNAQIIQAIRGTRALRYSDGILATTQRQAEAVVRTAVQHVSHVARLETLQANADAVKAYEWISTLDNRTSEICQSLSGQQFEVGKGPVPPAHVNCRSTIVPVLDERFAFLREGATQQSQFGPVDAKLTYFEWLKQQPASFQDAAIGPVRGKLLRDGGLSAKRFAELQLSRNFQPLTLAEMQRLEPLAFERAGITINQGTGRAVTAAQLGRAQATLTVPEVYSASAGGPTLAEINTALTALGKQGDEVRQFMNTHGTSVVFMKKSHIPTFGQDPKNSWGDWIRNAGEAPSREPSIFGGNPAEVLRRGFAERRNPGGVTTKGWNFVAVRLDSGTKNFAGVDIPKLKKHMQKVVEDFVQSGGVDRYISNSSATKLYANAAKTVGKAAREFLTFIHEMGHQVYYRAQSPDIPKAFARITEYSMTNNDEWFAEHFVAYVFDRDGLNRRFPDMVKFIDEALDAAMKDKGLPSHLRRNLDLRP